MATTYSTQVRTDSDGYDPRSVFLLAAYAGAMVLTIITATGTAAVAASFTTGLGQFVLVAGGWLAVVSASPELARRAMKRLDAVQFGHQTPRTSRAVTAAIAYLLAR